MTRGTSIQVRGARSHSRQHDHAVEADETSWRIVEVRGCESDEDWHGRDDVDGTKQAHDVGPSVLGKQELEREVEGVKNTEENLASGQQFTTS